MGMPSTGGSPKDPPNEALRIAGASSRSYVLALRVSQRKWPMQTPTEKIPNFLKTTEEPEQLDLFGWRPARQATSGDECGLSDLVCHRIVSVANLWYLLSDDQNNRLRDLLVRQCSADPVSPDWHDYILGLASTVSSLPVPWRQTFLQSDRAALASDWGHVQSDLDQVWRAITTVERICNERSANQ
jgi:hypothetical protein